MGGREGMLPRNESGEERERDGGETDEIRKRVRGCGPGDPRDHSVANT